MYKPAILGHTSRQTLISIPIAVISTAIVFDLAGFLTGIPAFGTVSYWMIAGGLMVAGTGLLIRWVEWLMMPVRAKGRAIWLANVIVNTAVFALFSAALYSRHDLPGHPQIIASFFSTIGTGLALIASWLGTETRPASEQESRESTITSLELSRLDTDSAAARGAH